MDKNTANNLVEKTRDDYNKIADHFTSTRKKGIWPDNLESINLINPEKGKNVLDIGCGSGRLYPLFKELGLNYLGIDLSDELIKRAKKEYPSANFAISNATELSFKDNEFDYVISVAVLYHIPSKELRGKALSEIFRVTKNGGKIYISVWYFWNKWRDVKLIIKETTKIILMKSKLDFGDFYRPWKTPDGKITTERYCHAWTSWGLKRALKKAGFTDLKIIKGYKNQTRNLNIVCKKP